MSEQTPPVVITATTGHWELPKTAQCSFGGSNCEGIGTYGPDPFDYDLNDRKIMRYLCAPCAQDMANEL